MFYAHLFNHYFVCGKLWSTGFKNLHRCPNNYYLYLVSLLTFFYRFVFNNILHCLDGFSLLAVGDIKSIKYLSTDHSGDKVTESLPNLLMNVWCDILISVLWLLVLEIVNEFLIRLHFYITRTHSTTLDLKDRHVIVPECCSE